MDQTALEAALEEATSEYLTHAGALEAAIVQRGRRSHLALSTSRPLATPSPLRLASPAPGWSKTSQLVPIRSDGDHIGSKGAELKSSYDRDKPARSAPQDEEAAPTSQSSSRNKAKDDRFPSGGLSSATESVRITLSSSPGLETDDGSKVAGSVATSSTLAAKCRARWALQDVYLNEYGEKVVNGKVVGQVLGGRRREGGAEVLSSKDQSPLSSPSHAYQPSAPPLFFQQSYPLSSSSSSPTQENCDATTSVTNEDVEGTLHGDSVQHSSSSVCPKSPAVDRAPSTKRAGDENVGTSPFQPPPAGAVLSVTDAQTGPVRLHGNRRLARQAGEPDPAYHSTNDAAAHRRKGRRERYADEGVTTEPFPADDAKEPSRSARRLEASAPLARRTVSLFYTPLLSQEQPLPSSPRPELVDGPANGRFKFASEPSSPTEASQSLDTSDNDAASLDSLPTSLISTPASTHTNSSASRSIRSNGSRDREEDGSGHERALHLSGSSPGQRSSSSRDRAQIFTASVIIKGWTEVGERGRGWIVFQVRVTTKTGITIALLRRFSSFLTLKKQLLAELPGFRGKMPQLPKKKLLNNHDALYLEQRRLGLQHWLQVIMLDPQLGSSLALREWVLDR